MLRPAQPATLEQLKALVGPSGYTVDPDELAPHLTEWRNRFVGKTPLLLKPANTNEVAVITTTEGEMVIEFWPEVAPKTVENFKTLAKKGFYDGTCFHRVIKGFMIQGGDPLTKDAGKEDVWGTGGPGYQIKAEFNGKSHVRGVISMARSANPDSAGSQFFICHGAAKFLDRQYTAFGELISGDDVLERIAGVPTKGAGGEKSTPIERVTLDSVKIAPAAA